MRTNGTYTRASKSKANGVVKSGGIAFRGTAAKQPVSKSNGKSRKDLPPKKFNVNVGVDAHVEYYNILLYGPPGSGKTVTAASAVDVEEMRDVFVIDSDRGLSSVPSSGAVKHHNDLVTVTVKSINELDTIAAFLEAYCKERDANNEEWLERYATAYGFPPEARFRTVIIDTISEIERINLDRLADGTEMPAFTSDATPDYKTNRPQIQRILRRFRNLDMHLIMTCHSDEVQDDKHKLNIRPKLSGKLAGDIFATVDVGAFMEQVKDENDNRHVVMHLQPGRRFYAKSRLTSIDLPYIEDASMQKLLDHRVSEN